MRLAAALTLAVALAAPTAASAQTVAGVRLTPFFEVRGPYQHVVVGASVAATNGDILPTASGSIRLPANARAAFGALFWQGSGAEPDLTVTLRLPNGTGLAITGDPANCIQIVSPSSGGSLPFWQCNAYVTAALQALPTLDGEYKIEGLIVDTHEPFRVSTGFPESTFAGSFALAILYVDPADQYPRTIQMARGLFLSQNIGDHASEPLLPFEMTANGGKATLVAIEGDKEFPVAGACNGSISDIDCDFFALCDGSCSDPTVLPLSGPNIITTLENTANPRGNIFNETVSTEFAGQVSGVSGEELNGLDIDTFDLKGRLPPRIYTSLRAAVQTGGDAVLQTLLVVEVTDADRDNDGLSNIEEEDVTGTDPNDPDTDHDGIPDGVEVHGGNPSDPKSNPTNPLTPDSDGDGLCDGSRSIANVCVGGEDKNNNGLLDLTETDPTNADTDGDGLSDRIEINGDYPGPRGPHTDPLRRDTDGDGLDDGAEDKGKDGRFDPANRETDPTNPDTDGGGENDGSERMHGREPTNRPDDDNGLGDDPDNDGLTTGQEVTIGTDPNNADTDGDGLMDGVEVNGGTRTNPKSSDTDGDGIEDGVEDRNHNGVREEDELNPTKDDTDGDGRKDGTEDRNHDGNVSAGETSGVTADSDADGLCDGAIAVGTTCIAGEDKNADGIMDADETSPIDNDSDDDGLSDGIEITAQYPKGGASDPLRADTDGDGLSDGAEDSNGDGRTASGETDPTNADSDGGGVDDGTESNNATDPTDPSDDDASGGGRPGGNLPDIDIGGGTVPAAGGDVRIAGSSVTTCGASERGSNLVSLGALLSALALATRGRRRGR